MKKGKPGIVFRKLGVGFRKSGTKKGTLGIVFRKLEMKKGKLETKFQKNQSSVAAPHC